MLYNNIVVYKNIKYCFKHSIKKYNDEKKTNDFLQNQIL